jgi:TetR/AcrR family transcriptional regulator
VTLSHSMPGISSNRVAPPLYQRQPPLRPRSDAKRTRIIEAATQHFAEHGYHAARIADIATALGIAKGSIFQHFGSKDGLFFEVYKRAVRSFAKYLDAPPEVRQVGFFEVLRYWLVRTDHLVREDWIPYRISLLGNYGTDLVLKREINRFLIAEDPYGTVSFVRFGLERRELRKDIDVEMIVSILDWMMERFQDALLTDELDPGLFRRQGEPDEKKEARIQQFLAVLERAIGADALAGELQSTTRSTGRATAKERGSRQRKTA